MSNNARQNERLVFPGMRAMLFIASGLVFIVGIQLFLFTTDTDRLFAWTINPPLTAAFLGASYWSSCVLEFLAAREATWARARIAVPAVLTFTLLTLITTLIHLDRFHLDIAQFELITVLLTWVWILVYAIVPFALAILLFFQLRVPGTDPPRRMPLPLWMRTFLVVQTVVMLTIGVLLFVMPTTLIGVWPWQLTPLTGRAIGAWFIGLGIATAHMIWENDASRIQPAFLSMVAFSLLQFIALARYAGDVAWDTVAAWLYLFFLVTIAQVGSAGIWLFRSPAAESTNASPKPNHSTDTHQQQNQ
ncbi:MAG: hypothetical protein HC837_00630 [Chloroflexaceae bacterium]|nr:hypothetical protein [Chloroflexaceae bacterium]